MDTSDLRLHDAGFAARLRGANGEAEATLKSVVSDGDPESGLRRRLELNEPLRYALLYCLAGARGVVGSRIRQHATLPELRVLFTVRTDRRTAIVSAEAGVDLGEVAFDETTIEAGDRTKRIRRIEVEALAPGAEAALEPFVDLLRETHGLRPGTSSKFRSGLALAREAGLVAVEIHEPAIVRPAPRAAESDAGTDGDDPSLAPLPEESLAALVRGVLTTQLAIVRSHEAGTRLGDDIEALHDMRVAVRRLRSALRLFAKVLPRGRQAGPGATSVSEIDTSLRWLASELGVVRDLDVQLERIEEWRAALEEQDANALGPLADLLRAQRQAARVSMAAAMDTPRLVELYRTLELLSAVGPGDLPRRALRPAVIALPRMLRRQYRAFRSRAGRIEPDPGVEAELLHATRIRAKRLRYATEFATPIYGKRARALVSALKDAQDVLGLHQDAEVAIAALRRLVADAGGELPPRTLFAMGEVAQRYRDSQREQQRAVPDAAASVRRRWRRTEATMRRAARD